MVLATPAGFPSWCAGCDWGLPRSAPLERRGILERAADQSARRLDEISVANLSGAEGLRPRWGAPRIAATAIAAGVLALWLAFVVAAVLLVLRDGTNPFADVLALALTLLAFVMRPRLGRVPGDGVVERHDAPALYALVEDVARMLGSRSADVIRIDHRYNASWGVYGLRRRRVLTLGLPLVAALEHDGLVALLAHEVGHEANGDPLRGLVVGSSTRALHELTRALTPHPDEGRYEFGPFAGLTSGMLRVLVWPFAALLHLQILLFMRDSQRGEYLADHRAAQVAGTDAELGSEDALLLRSYLEGVLQRHALDHRNQGVDVIELLRVSARAVPEGERERRRRVARLENARLSATHPTTARRMEALRLRPVLAPRLVLDARGPRSWMPSLRPSSRASAAISSTRGATDSARSDDQRSPAAWAARSASLSNLLTPVRGSRSARRTDLGAL